GVCAGSVPGSGIGYRCDRTSVDAFGGDGGGSALAYDAAAAARNESGNGMGNRDDAGPYRCCYLCAVLSSQPASGFARQVRTGNMVERQRLEPNTFHAVAADSVQ